VGEKLAKVSVCKIALEKIDGSCMIVIATDAPVSCIGKSGGEWRSGAMMGVGQKNCGIASNGSGDYCDCFSARRKVCGITLFCSKRDFGKSESLRK